MQGRKSCLPHIFLHCVGLFRPVLNRPHRIGRLCPATLVAALSLRRASQCCRQTAAAEHRLRRQSSLDANRAIFRRCWKRYATVSCMHAHARLQDLFGIQCIGPAWKFSTANNLKLHLREILGWLLLTLKMADPREISGRNIWVHYFICYRFWWTRMH
jgi:hypothetical protein